MSRRIPMLIGHHEQRRAFLDALGHGRMHHAWLLAGPRGIGKRRFADWAALKLLSGEGGEGDVDPQHPAARLVAAGSHPDLRLLLPPEDSKTGVIQVAQVRDMADFLHSYASLAGWRLLVVDSLDAMNISAANAFLKELEEPRPKTIYLLVSHAPARLLPTLRSRCRTLRFSPLADEETHAVLQQEIPESGPAAVEAMTRLAEGAPGAVLSLADADIAGLERALDQVARGGSPLSLARSFQGQAAVPKLEALALMVPRRLAAAARETPRPELFALYDEAEALGRDAVRLAYDRVQVAMALADILARAGQLQRTPPAP
jgi:DNA polymerase-3 subunit delta'